MIWLLAAVAVAATPLTLDGAIARALKTYPDVLSADAQAQSARLGVQDAESQRLALTAAVSSLGRHATTGLLDTGGKTPTSSDTAAANTTIQAVLPVFTGFKITNGIQAAMHRQDEAGAARKATRQDLVYAVSQAYWNLYRQEALVRTQASVGEDADRAVKLAQTTVRVGRGTPMDVTRARVALLSTRGDILSATAQAQEARTTLAKLVGLAADEVRLADAAPPVPPPGQAAAKTANPRLAAAHEHAAAAKADLDVAGGDRWPQLAVISTYQYGNNPFDPTLGASALGTTFGGTWDVRLSLSYNVFDLGKINRQIQRSQADLTVAQASEEKARRDAESDLALARRHVENAYQRFGLADEGSQLAKAQLQWTETRYQQGYGLQLEIIDARRTLLTSLTQRVQALCDYQIARAELAHAEGAPTP